MIGYVTEKDMNQNGRLINKITSFFFVSQELHKYVFFCSFIQWEQKQVKCLS